MVDGGPVGIKDIMDTHDLPTQMGSPAFTGWKSRYDAAYVHALRAGGAIIVGKTVTTAFACGVTNVTCNPHDAARTARCPCTAFDSSACTCAPGRRKSMRRAALRSRR